jgi:hypothetical protein
MNLCSRCNEVPKGEPHPKTHSIVKISWILHNAIKDPALNFYRALIQRKNNGWATASTGRRHLDLPEETSDLEVVQLKEVKDTSQEPRGETREPEVVKPEDVMNSPQESQEPASKPEVIRAQESMNTSQPPQGKTTGPKMILPKEVMGNLPEQREQPRVAEVIQPNEHVNMPPESQKQTSELVVMQPKNLLQPQGQDSEPQVIQPKQMDASPSDREPEVIQPEKVMDNQEQQEQPSDSEMIQLRERLNTPGRWQNTSFVYKSEEGPSESRGSDAGSDFFERSSWALPLPGSMPSLAITPSIAPSYTTRVSRTAVEEPSLCSSCGNANPPYWYCLICGSCPI